MLIEAPTLAETLADALWSESPQETPDMRRAFATAELRRLGVTRRQIRRAVAGGELRAARRGVYLLAGAPPPVMTAVAAGGRVGCVSALAALGVFVIGHPQTHLHFERGVNKHAPAQRTQTWHWQPLARAVHRRATTVDVFDALVQSTVCQEPRAAIATLDSALLRGLIRPDDLDELFDLVPPRRRVLQRLVDGRAESGPETLLRLMALSLGFAVELQVKFDGIGRVDLVLDGWLVVECDSQAHHSGWENQKKDRRRDLALAALGMASLRPVAEDIMYNPSVVREALRGLRAARVALTAGAN